MKKVIKLLLVSLATATLLSACAEKPEAELGAAKSAVDAVVSEGAEKYIPEAMQSINRKLEEAQAEIKAQDDVTFSNYSAAKLTLSQVKEEADALKVKVAQRKEELKVAANAALNEAQAVVAEAKALLEVAPQGKGSIADIEAMKSDVVGLETELEAVTPQIDAGEYVVATEKAHAVATRALMISNDVKTAQEKLAVVIKK
jgi:CHASE3 domain sensor protein